MKQITVEEFIENIKKDPSWCKNLKEPIEITTCAQLYNCEALKIATGTFNGTVNFYGSGITTIKDLIINESKAYFDTCPIKYVPKEYRGKEFVFNEIVIKNSNKKDKIVKETINKIKLEANNIII